MKKRNLLSIVLAIVLLFSLAGCKEKDSTPTGILVTYDLNGGTFQNCTLPIKQYYTYSASAKKIIVDPETLVKDVIQKSGYTLEGWYTDTNYTDKWDFKNDVLTTENLTLYAKWVKDIKYTYNVCYIDESTNETIIINSYNVEAGEKFEDYRDYANKREGYTAFEFVDKLGNPWDFEYTHPGGDTDLAINVYVNYIKGEYKIVSTKKEFINAVSKCDNIYLLNDIDLEGEEISFGDYTNQVFEGNGYTVSNFKVTVNVSFPQHLVKDHTDESKNSAYVSLFGNIEKATIQNVNFDNVIFELSVTPARTYRIYLAPLATSIKDSTIANVTINSTYVELELPNGFDVLNNLITTNDYYIVSNEDSNIDNVTLNMNKGE